MSHQRSTTIAGLPKAELHTHLNGCVPPSLFRELLLEAGIVKPDDIVLTRDLMNLEPRREGLRAYFRPWHLIRKLPLNESSLKRIVDAAVAHLRDDNISYVELRHSVVHVAAKNHLTIDQTLCWLLEALDDASVRHEVDARLIVTLVRHEFLTERMPELLDALRARRDHCRLVGIDLAGDEDHFDNPEWEKLILAAQSEVGLGVTIHAGETGRKDNIRWAIEACRATRIGHGLAAGSDTELLHVLRDRNVCVEVCLTSNFLTARVPDLAEHPVGAFIEHNVPFVICADNPQMHAKSLSSEYQLFEELFNRRDLLDQMFALQKRFAFGSDC